ncbi:MAG: sulfurtransferase TusA family protein [Peptococcaceae bacterium]|jgi:tRNA 2-thiouridine synthesizing protein A|nr:sulfurtransferase TusA family protein [Peptococcaceae bacterium]
MGGVIPIPKAFLDITGDVCPLTFVKTKLRLEELAPGDVLEVRLQGPEPLQNVPRSAKEEGHRVLAVKHEGACYHLFIQKGEQS